MLKGMAMSKAQAKAQALRRELPDQVGRGILPPSNNLLVEAHQPSRNLRGGLRPCAAAVFLEWRMEMLFALWQLVIILFVAVLGAASLACVLRLAYSVWRDKHEMDEIDRGLR